MLTLIAVVILVLTISFTIGALYGLHQLNREANPDESRKWEALRYQEWVKKHSR